MTPAIWLRGLLIALALYLGCAAMARLLAARSLYYPEAASRRPPSGGKTIRDAAGRPISVLHLPNSRARYTIWFFHGNAEALGDLEPWFVTLRDAGFSVFAAEYPGYGVSGGHPSESSLYAAARAAREYLRGVLNISAERTVIYGRSLGGGPAVQMATEEAVGGLILQSSFTSVYRVVTRRRMLPFDYFENARKLPQVSSPVLVLHGENDEVIPFAHARDLFAVANEPKRFFSVPGAGHNDFLTVAGPRYWEALREFSELCARRGAP